MSELSLRLARTDDAGALRAIYAPYVETTAVTFEESVPSLADMRRRIETAISTLPWLVCETAEGIEGYAYATSFRPRPAYRYTVETTVYVHEARRGHGVGSALIRSLLAVLRLQGYRLAVAGIALPNDASVRLHEAHGFVRAGLLERVGFKLGRWHDVGWWTLELQQHGAAPPPLRPLLGLDDAVLDEAIAAGSRYVTRAR